ncbi:hypothetical protein Cme02nite_28420 [Catellatospora methionotrophica]|uniref:Uncharacterized protein n=1 Tax=Catellatospora methionotrophica TaxID=121620 RepID=A0A8J3L941_9ACTN|nr:hypothetical protein Cme02nite_28420 [Catellatospora methionotrophica]
MPGVYTSLFAGSATVATYAQSRTSVVNVISHRPVLILLKELLPPARTIRPSLLVTTHVPVFATFGCDGRALPEDCGPAPPPLSGESAGAGAEAGICGFAPGVPGTHPASVIVSASRLTVPAAAVLVINMCSLCQSSGGPVTTSPRTMVRPRPRPVASNRVLDLRQRSVARQPGGTVKV